MLQVVVARGLRAGRSAAHSVNVAQGSAKSVVNGKHIAASRSVSLTQAALRQSSRAAVMKYSTKASGPGGDMEQVWEDVDGTNDFYDPRWDNDSPEEEGGWGNLFDDMSDEEYARLVELADGLKNEGKAAKESGEEKMVSAAAGLASAITAASSKPVVTKPAKKTTLDGIGAAVRLRLGTLNLPSTLLERIRLLLKDSNGTPAMC
jgi:hypothetical protein